MKSWFKKPTGAILITASLIVFMAISNGCSQKPQKTPTNKLTVWHWMTDRKAALEKLAQKYKNETGVEVEFKLFFPADIYSSKVIAAARAKNLPDIFGILGEKKTVASFISAGHILDLTPYMQADDSAWKKKFYPKTLEVVIFPENNKNKVKPGIYGVPIDTTIMQFIYNKTLLEKASINTETPVQSFDDFIRVAKQVKETTGVDGFVCGFGESWLLNALATEWAVNIMGQDNFVKTIKGEIPYNNSQWLQVFSLFETLRNSGIFPPNVGSMNNKESEDAFSKEKAVFSFNGSWAVNVYNQKNPNLNYGFFSLPEITDSHPIKVWGGSGSTFRVNAYSQQKELAVAFLKWLSSKDQQEYLIEKTNNLPAIRGCDKKLSPLLLSLLKNIDHLTHPDTWDVNENSRVLEILNRGLQQIIMGIKTAKEVAEEVQQVKERVSK
jgi:raffinose/stachyose/melibiose transport system substrate-binding protein